MSWITIAVFAILILFGVSGWSKGIIRTAVSLAAMVVTFIVCVWVTPSLCKNVKENTQVYDNLQKSIYNFIIEDENFNKAAGESLSDEEAVIISISQLEEYAGQIQKNVNDIMKKLNLPESVIGSGNGNGSYMQDVFHVTGNAQVTMKNIMAAVIAAKLAGLALNAIIYIAVYLVVFAVTGVVGRLPLIYQANKLLGLAFGIIEGLVIVWLLFAVITACSNMQWAAKALIEIGKNDLLSLIYNHNFIIKTITKTV